MISGGSVRKIIALNGWFWGILFYVVKPIIWGNEGEMMGWLGWFRV
jgi:hypothetical protein